MYFFYLLYEEDWPYYVCMEIRENENTGLFCYFFSSPARFLQDRICSSILVFFDDLIDPLPGYPKIIRYFTNRFSFLPLFNVPFNIRVG